MRELEDETGTDDDPVRAYGDGDLQNVATWEPRSALDRFAVWLDGAIRTGAASALVGIAALVLLGQLALTAAVFAREPLIAVYAALSVLPAAALVGYIWWGDPTLREPLDALAVTFVLGGLLAGFAAVLNTAVGPVPRSLPIVGTAVFFFVVVGPVEEVVKWLAVRLYAYPSDDFRAVIDGAVYGAAAGLGFATVENAFYITSVYYQAATMGADVAVTAGQVTVVRSLAGPGHVLYSAIAGYYLGLAKFQPGDAGPIAVKGLVIAAGLHALYNTGASMIGTIVPGTLAVFVLYIVVVDGAIMLYLFRRLAAYKKAYHGIEASSD